MSHFGSVANFGPAASQSPAFRVPLGQCFGVPTTRSHRHAGSMPGTVAEVKRQPSQKAGPRPSAKAGTKAAARAIRVRRDAKAAKAAAAAADAGTAAPPMNPEALKRIAEANAAMRAAAALKVEQRAAQRPAKRTGSLFGTRGRGWPSMRPAPAAPTEIPTGPFTCRLFGTCPCGTWGRATTILVVVTVCCVVMQSAAFRPPQVQITSRNFSHAAQAFQSRRPLTYA